MSNMLALSHATVASLPAGCGAACSSSPFGTGDREAAAAVTRECFLFRRLAAPPHGPLSRSRF